MKFLLAVLTVVCLAGCVASEHALRIDSISRIEDPAAPLYTVLPDERVGESDLAVQSFIELLQNELGYSGFHVAPTLQEATAVIRVRIEESEPDRQTVYRSSPVYGVTGERVWREREQRSDGTYHSVTRRDPVYGVVGTDVQTNIVTIYQTSIFLKAFAKESPTQPIWQTRITVIDNEGDFRRIAPTVLRASRGYLGRTTQGVQELKIEMMDDGTSEIKVGPDDSWF